MAKIVVESIRTRLLRALIVIALLIVVVMVVGFVRLLQVHVEHVSKLASYPNQACMAIGIAAEDGLSLKPYTIDAYSNVGPLFNTNSAPQGLTGQQTCFTGTVLMSQTKSPSGSGTSEGYTLGATVQYFKNATDAEAYARNSLNKTRSWSVDATGVKNNISQTSLFTYLFTDVSEPYFDSYTVRDKAVLTLSLPCTMSADLDAGQNFDACNEAAQKVLKAFGDTVQRNLQQQELF